MCFHIISLSILHLFQFYGELEARKYTSNSHMIAIQTQMSERAIELLSLNSDQCCFILDVGCGSGLSGEVLTDQGHFWVGIDISPHMLEVACEREVEGDLILSDVGHGLTFRPGTFDACISISALQWLCNADRKEHIPRKRLHRFFTSLYSVLKRGSRAVFQIYPENSAQIELMTEQAMKAGFTGGLVVDYPNSSRAKKMFLVLFVGGNQIIPRGLTEEQARVKNTNRKESRRQSWGKAPKKSVPWIMKKKEQMRKKGKEVKSDSKYTGRKRKGRF